MPYIAVDTRYLALSEPQRETLGSVAFCLVPVCIGAAGIVEPRERACVAQLAEHVLGKDEVSGSIPLAGSK